MKVRILKLTPEHFVKLLQGKPVPSLNLPSDTEVLDVKMDLFSKQVLAIIRSGSFEDVAESFPIPEFNPAVVKNATKLAAAVKAEPKPELELATAKPAQPSKPPLKMENEFSPEQREVLSFTVKGDVVVVKPIQFLKEEWEEINGVVKSLGGKWVKGDIISYWEIPLQS